MKKVPSLSAKACESSTGTALRCRRSALLPTSMITMLASVWSLSSFSHRPTLSNVASLMTLSPTRILRVANSTPMVDLDSRLNSLRVKRDKRFDLPTPESPISTTLNR
ncbi:unnamed protein product [Spirodela intermedia]|uniref:Uncharacterized protein n=1 Tax=Spirodela intermedia TaxID=51605 RepID=A0A7I8JS43_SPIIN|nr:unnamed protein product [Spirodela intermedia]CAA6672959.1 unnamed protein product [Spirodela intermedia]